MTKEALEARLLKAGIDPDVFADMIWSKLSGRIVTIAKRQEILAAVSCGLAVKWNGDDAKSCACLIEKLTDAIMHQESLREQR